MGCYIWYSEEGTITFTRFKHSCMLRELPDSLNFASAISVRMIYEIHDNLCAWTGERGVVINVDTIDCLLAYCDA